MFPCSLKREPCLRGRELADRLSLDPHYSQGSSSMSTPIVEHPVSILGAAAHHNFWASPSRGSTGLFRSMLVPATEGLPLVRVHANVDEPAENSDGISPFERLISTYEPILQTLLDFLPTSSVFSLYHTSRFLRNHLHSYPLAWKTLSFRLPQPTNNLVSPGVNSPDPSEWQSKQYALDLVLKRVVLPLATRLTSLDLCNTSITGDMLVGVLELRKETIQHVSVRGCKHVSLKYHIVPFLHRSQLEIKRWGDTSIFALKSLYTYRCRHHRRRPYLPSSLARRDSDSEPTHDLIELCHQLGIWTDTAWCPTPGPRCHRRKDYHGNRAAPGTMEVWVPFDRLWRSSNRIGPADDHLHKRSTVGKLWEEIECGHDGEALGTKESALFVGEGKDVPTHLRKSHKTFVDNVKCDNCGDQILERCETCSIRMHCMGCRKTLCASCAFNRPLKKKRRLSSASDASTSQSSETGSTPRSKKNDKKDKFWWAPGATRSPNMMTDISEDPDSDDEAGTRQLAGRQQQQQHQGPLKIKMHWCCLEPIFSGGGGVAFVGPGLGGHGSERIRAVPLQQTREYMDPDFAPADSTNAMEENFQKFDERVNSSIDILPYLQQPTLELQAKTCPRCLCNSCYESFRWKVECKACKRPICKEHDFRALKVRKCGYRDLTDEREYVRNPPKNARDDMARSSDWPRDLQIPEFRPVKPGESSSPDSPTAESSIDDERRPRQADVSESQEWSDAGSQADGPSTRDPSSTPRATPLSYADRSSSVASRGPAMGDRDTSTLLPHMEPVERAGFVASTRPPVRARSYSTSELAASVKGKGRLVQQPVPKERLLLPCNSSHPVQWKGCGSYTCQGSRSVGDTRPRCFASGKECSECGVYVCQGCLPKSPPCTCSFCDRNYHCPHCFSKPEMQSQCLREAELRARELALEKERKAEEARIAQERRDREQADSILNWGTEFWSSLLVDGYGYIDENALSTRTEPAEAIGEARAGAQEDMREQVEEEAPQRASLPIRDAVAARNLDDGEETDEDVVPPPALAA